MARLGVELFADPTALERGLKKGAKDVSRFNTAVTRTGKQGSKAFAGIGKSLALATGGLIAFGGATKFLRDSIAEAEEAGVANRALAAQMKAAGESFQANQVAIDKLARSYMKFGFEDDEVIASLAVLERGTGKISEAFKLQQLTADIARAKHLDLAKAALVVAKVFGGQETALRRQVPGLAKNAHGWDLIRLAQAKMAGQAAAATTPSERFNAVLKDVEQTIGDALLPIINKYLDRLSEWLIRMQESGRLQKDVTAAVNVLKDAISVASSVVGAIKTSFEALNTVTGSTKDTLKLLFQVFIGFKLAKFASELKLIATNIGLVGTNAAKATPKVEALAAAGGAGAGGKGGGKGGLGVGLLALGGELLARFGGLGASAGQIKGKAAEDFLRANGLLPPKQGRKGAPPGLRGPTAPFVPPGLEGPITAEAVRAAKRTAEQRNAWFDAMIGRRIDRVQDEPLKQQLVMLARISTLITQRIGITKDITRKLNLEDQLLQVARMAAAVRSDIAAQAAEAAQAARDEALAWADFAVEKAAATKGLKDDLKAAQDRLKLLEKQAGVGKKTAAEARAIWEQQQEINRIRKEMGRAEKGFATRFKPMNVSAFIQSLGLGLSVDAMRRLAVALAQLGPGGTLPAGRSAAFAGAGGITVAGDVHISGVQNAKDLERELHRRARRRAAGRRGN